MEQRLKDGPRDQGISSDRRLKGDGKTQSGIEVEEVYGPEALSRLDFDQEIGRPGAFPFTRGAYPRMYRERLWVSGSPAFGGATPYIEELGRTTDDYFDELFDKGIVSSGIRTSGDYHNLATVDPR